MNMTALAMLANDPAMARSQLREKRTLQISRIRPKVKWHTVCSGDLKAMTKGVS